jgi:hypothetical protein
MLRPPSRGFLGGGWPQQLRPLPYFKPTINVRIVEVLQPSRVTAMSSEDDDEPTRIHPFISRSAQVIDEGGPRGRQSALPAGAHRGISL